MKSLFLMLVLLPFTQAAEKPIFRTINDKEIKWGPCPAIFPKGCEIGVLQGVPEKKNADVFLRFPGNYTIPPHSHTSAEHMILVEGNLEVKYMGGETVNLTKGTYAFGPAKLAHAAKCLSNDPCVLFISFDEPIDAIPFNGKI